MIEYLIASVVLNVLLLPTAYILLEKFLYYRWNYHELAWLYQDTITANKELKDGQSRS